MRGRLRIGKPGVHVRPIGPVGKMAAVDSVVRPAPLRTGDEVRVVAPARSRALVLEPDRTAFIEQRFADLGLKLTYGAHVDEIDDFTSSPIASG